MKKRKSNGNHIRTELNDWEFEILDNKLPRQKVLRINILLGLDIEFNFNRTKLAKFLEKENLPGYSRGSLYKILGSPVLRSDEYKAMQIALERIGETTLLNLIVRKSICKIHANGSLGSKPIRE